MSTFSVADARRRFAEVLDECATTAVTIERRGARAAVVVSPEQYDRMVDALEELEDMAAFDAAMSDEDPNISWAQAKVDLGWE